MKHIFCPYDNTYLQRMNYDDGSIRIENFIEYIGDIFFCKKCGNCYEIEHIVRRYVGKRVPHYYHKTFESTYTKRNVQDDALDGLNRLFGDDNT